MQLNLRSCEQALGDYNKGVYRGVPNVELDARGYEMFRALDFGDRDSVFRCVLFVGRDYGGAQERFLPEDGYSGESRRIARRVLRCGDLFERAVRDSAPLTECLPDRNSLSPLMEAFEASKRWPVWASKFLHFAAPEAFAILDSRAREFFEVRRQGSDYTAEYLALLVKVQEAVASNKELLDRLMAADPYPPPSLLKIIDKVAFSSGSGKART